MKLTHNSKYVNLPRRFVAGVIDWQISDVICLYSFTWLVNIATLSEFIPTLAFNLAYIWLPLAIFYSLFLILMLSKTGYSPGKYLLGIRIADINQNLVSFKRIIFRELIAKKISAALLMLGFLNIAIDPNHQSWHDHLSNTYATNTDRRPILGAIIALALLSVQIYLYYTVITNFLANQALIGDLQFVFEPLLGLLK